MDVVLRTPPMMEVCAYFARILKADILQLLWSFKGHTAAVSAAAISIDAQQLLTTGTLVSTVASLTYVLR
jgi:hypothetical protein